MSLIHFAAHGDAERGEIALAPPSATEGIPHEPDYLLSTGEASEVKLTAKLVVLKLLSYCVWANESRSEGVVGISRAFLGSGARSVLIALVDHRRQSNRVVHEPSLRKPCTRRKLRAIISSARVKWTRNSGFSKWRPWAPFVLIGDDVSFDFGKPR